MEITLKELQSIVVDASDQEEIKALAIDPNKRYLFITKELDRSFIEQLSIALARVLNMPVPPLLICNSALFENLKVFELERYGEVQ